MEHVRDRSDHDAPWNQDENPRCADCDEQMEQRSNIMGSYYICINPDCELCDPKYKPAAGDDAICTNCDEVIVFGHAGWEHQYVGECEKPERKR